MTELEIFVAKELETKVTFLPASFDKRFSRDMYHKSVATPEAILTEKQSAYLLSLAYKYRRQIPEACDRLPANLSPKKQQGLFTNTHNDKTQQAPLEREHTEQNTKGKKRPEPTHKDGGTQIPLRFG